MEQAPRWFVPVAVVALLWNLMGAAIYLMDVTMSPDAIAALSAAQQEVRASRPVWLMAAFALAVWVGTLGSLGLVLKRSWAKPALVISLVAALVQAAWIFGMSNAAAVDGAAVYGIQGTILVIGVALVLLANTASARGWLR